MLCADTRLTVEDIGRKEAMTASYITRIMRLVFLDPAMTETILRGEQRVDLDLSGLMALAQRQLSGLPH